MGFDVPLPFEPSRREDDAPGGERRARLLRRGASFRGLVLAAAVSTVLGCLVPAGAQATTFTVTSSADSGPGALRSLLASAGAGDKIRVPGSMTITLATPLTVTQPGPQGVTIAAKGSGMPTISGGNTTGIFSLNANSALTLNGLLVTRGRGGGDGNAIQGGIGSAVAINDSVVSDNGSGDDSGDGGAIQMFSPGTLTIRRSSVVGNFGGTISGNGGAIQMNSPGTLTIVQSTLADNRAGLETGYGGAIQMNGPGTVTISQSTLARNSAGADGGDGGAIQMNSPGTLNLTNVTLFDNSGGGNGGAIQMNTPAMGSILNTTIAGNRATDPASNGGGIQINSGASNSLSFKNTIVSGNTAPGGANCGATAPPLASLGHNLENGTSCGFSGNGDLNADPRLDTQLRANGGPTSTLALLPGSPALDMGSATGADQRGAPRPFNLKGVPNSGTPGANGADIGSYERVLCGGILVNRVGTPGGDKLKGTKRNDGILGLAGRDKLNGRAGKDGLCGGPGNDVLKGGKGNDKLFGGPGRDRLFGGPGLDLLVGGPGKDEATQ